MTDRIGPEVQRERGRIELLLKMGVDDAWKPPCGTVLRHLQVMVTTLAQVDSGRGDPSRRYVFETNSLHKPSSHASWPGFDRPLREIDERALVIKLLALLRPALESMGFRQADSWAIFRCDAITESGKLAPSPM
jgi:hypothetical protein